MGASRSSLSSSCKGCLQGVSHLTRCSRGPCSLGSRYVSHTGTPLPPVQHKVVERQEVAKSNDPGANLIVIGDVHGCDDELEKLLEKAKFSPKRDTLVMAGDLVHKGPKSVEVVRRVRRLGGYLVRGNHEDQLLEAWHRIGRYANSVEGYRERWLLTDLTAEEILWVQEAPFTLSFPWLNLLVVHAGLVPGVPLESQEFEDMAWMRDLVPNKNGGWKALQKPAKESSAWASIWNGPPHVVFGHDAKRRLQQHPKATGLDTACCYGHELSALIFDIDGNKEPQLCQVPAARAYAEKKGV